MSSPVIQRSFGGGELAPVLHARADSTKYQTGLRTCRNFIVQRGGGVTNRPGTRYTATAKTAAATVQLLRYVSELPGDSVLIEAGFDYFRFFRNGAPVTVTAVAPWSAIVNYIVGDIVSTGGVNYYARAASLNQVPPNATYWYPMPAANLLEIPNPFLGQRFHWHQSGRVITLTHYDVAPYELVYVTLTRWIVRAVVTGPGVTVPTGLAGVAGAAGALEYRYVITAAAAETYEESNPTAPAAVINCAVPTPAAPIVLTWNAVAGSPEYYVYCDPFKNGTYGYLGTATGAASFRDVGEDPDFAVTPPIPRALFVNPNDWPHHSASYQQRRFFAHSHNRPDGVWGSRTGFPANFGIASPLQDDDALTFAVAGNQNNPVRHLLGLKSLVLLTDAGGWTVNGGGDGRPMTPSSINPDQMVYVGATDPAPVVVGNTMLYVQTRGRIMRDLRFDMQVEGLGGRDLTLFASHLFDAYTISAVDYQHTPHSVVWVCRSDGTLLGLTYIPEEDAWGWHRHDTGASGQFTDVCVVPETNQDAVYFIVKRTVNGTVRRYIERLEPREIVSFNRDAFFVDAGLTYTGPPATTITGLDHLEGQVVAVLGDGQVVYNGDPAGADAARYTVTGGRIVLPAARSIVHAGLPIRYAEIEALDLDVAGSDVRSKAKTINRLTLLLDKSSRGFSCGQDSTHLIPHKLQPWESTVAESSGLVEQAITTGFSPRGRVMIRQTEPLPLTILGIIPHLEVGG